MPKISAPARLGDLGRGDADASGGGVDQRPLALLEPAHDHERGVSGRVVDRDGGALLEAELLRQRIDLVDGNRDQLGVAAESRPGEHAVAGLEVLHPVADRLDLARDLVADDARRARSVWIDARARHQIGEVDPRRLDRNPDLAGTDGRVRPLLDAQDLRPTMLGDHDSAHRARTLFAPRGSRGRRRGRRRSRRRRRSPRRPRRAPAHPWSAPSPPARGSTRRRRPPRRC